MSAIADKVRATLKAEGWTRAKIWVLKLNQHEVEVDITNNPGWPIIRGHRMYAHACGQNNLGEPQIWY